MKIKNLIRYSYLLLFLLTPLLFSSQNSELFELPKMHFAYGLTILIVCLHLISYIQGQSSLLPQNYITLPLLIFLLSQIISTFTSVDPITSIFGYHSRLNGGLLSSVCYSLLSLILAVHIQPHFLHQIINTSLISGLLVCFYAIGQHFGIDKHIWVQDVQARVFSTLGQPNWLAAYICILLPLSLYKALASSSFYHLLFPIFYLSLLFTKSKSGLITALICLSLFFIFYLITSKNKKQSFHRLLIPVCLFIFLSLVISSPIKDLISPTPSPITTPSSTLIEENYNITPSQDIRRIVWRGAIDLWKQFPLFGTGVETFAYSYYWTRPASHNLTSEWEFLYNKAHNEYINYLATTGTLGLFAYLLLIFFILKKIVKDHRLLNLGLLTAALSILLTNFAGFSVVITNLYLFLLPALAHHPTPSAKGTPLEPKASIGAKPKPKILYLLPIVLFLFLSLKNLRFYLADIAYATATKTDQPSQKLEYLQRGLSLHPQYPVYLSQISLAYATDATQTTDTVQQQKLIESAIFSSNQATHISPANISLWKQQAQMYYLLSTLDTTHFVNAIDSLTKAIALAPTDAKNYFLLARFLETANQIDSAVKYYQKALDLKANYDHAHFALGQIYFSQKNYQLAQSHFKSALQINPKNQTASEYLTKIKPFL